MPFAKIMVHFIWATKNRSQIIDKTVRPLLLSHIKDNGLKKGIYIDTVNCVVDHIHLLVSLGTEQTVAKVAQMIKGESSFWMNRENLINTKFEWQDDYIALSVSESAISKVRAYIVNQEEHHRTKTFGEEYDSFLKLHNFSIES